MQDILEVCCGPGVRKEIGVDMSAFKTSQHICSWAGLSPGNNESAGKKSTRITHDNTHIKSLLCETA